MRTEPIDDSQFAATTSSRFVRNAVSPPRAVLRKHVVMGAVVWVFFLLVVCGTAVRSHLQSIECLRWVEHTQNVQLQLSQLHSLLIEAETGQRGYLLTGQQEYLKPYRASTALWRQQFEKVRAATKDNPRQQERLIALKPIIDAKMKELKKSISVANEQGREAAFNFVRSDQGRLSMAHIRNITDDLATAEIGLLGRRQVAAANSVRTTNLIVVLCMTTVIFISFALIGRILQQIGKQRSAANKLRETSELTAAILDSSGEGIYGVDLDGNCTFANAACVRMLGYKDDGDLRGQNMHNLIHRPQHDETQFPDQHGNFYQTFEKGRSIHIDSEVLWRADGTSFPAEYWSRPLTIGGQVTGAVASFMDVTQGRAAEIALQRSEERFDLAMQGSSDGLWDWNLETDEVYLSPRWKSMLGYDKDEIEPHIDAALALIHPDDRQHVQDTIDGYLYGDAEQYEVEFRIQHKNQTYVHILSRGFAVRQENDGKPTRMVGTHVDMTDQKRNEEKLSLFKTTLDQITDGVFMFRHETLEFFYTNQGAVEQVGYTPDELLKMTVLDIKPDYDEEGFRELVNPLVHDELPSLRFETIHRQKGGKHIPVEVCLQYIDSVDGSPHFVAVVRDISDRRKHEESLRSAKEEAERANRTKSDFLANMSHEIRTPLNGILGFTDLLLRAAETEGESVRHLQIIRSCGKNLLALINDILDLSKIEAGRMEFERERCSPHQIITEAISLLRVRALEKCINLEWCWQRGVPETIETDSVRLRQLLMNLIGNAIKFTESGSVALKASVDAASAAPRLILEIRDTGIGIAPSHLDKIFQPFDQADGSITRQFGGTGLGLPISRHIAQGLGGDITLESEPGVGSVFRVTIDTGSLDGVRILDVPMAESILPGTPTANRRAPNLQNARILLCEDGETNRELIGLVLSDAGADVTFAENGQAGVDAVEEAESPFDVILMDMQMPVLDGYSATRRVRNLGWSTPIVALTAHAMRGDEKKCRDAGCSGYLTKPIDIDELLRALDKSVREKDSRSDPGIRSENRVAPINAEANLQNGTSKSVNPEPIYSTVPTDRPAFQKSVEQFTERLSGRLDDMQAAIDADDAEHLAELAHWLRGSGGTIGLDCFTEPARSLERSAEEKAFEEAQNLLNEISGLVDRIVLPWRDVQRQPDHQQETEVQASGNPQNMHAVNFQGTRK